MRTETPQQIVANGTISSTGTNDPLSVQLMGLNAVLDHLTEAAAHYALRSVCESPAWAARDAIRQALYHTRRFQFALLDAEGR